MKERLKVVRAWPPINRPLTTLARALARKDPPEFLVSHLPRMGVVTLDVGGTPVRFWSEGDDWITSRVWWRGLSGFEPETIHPFLDVARSARVVFDCGAYIGYYSLLAAATNRRAQIFAFEPHRGIAARLGRNISLNPWAEITICPYAVGARRGPSTFHVGAPGLPSSSSLSDEWKGLFESRKVGVIDLDSFCEDWGITGIDLIKLDVEKTEADVLEGMPKILERDRPVIFAEVLRGSSLEDPKVSSRLRAMSYRLLLLSKAGATEQREIRAFKGAAGADLDEANYMLVPEEKASEWLNK